MERASCLAQSLEELAKEGNGYPGEDTAQIKAAGGAQGDPALEIVHWHQRPEAPCGVPFKRELPRTENYEEVTCPQCAAQVVANVLQFSFLGENPGFPIQPTPILPERSPPQRHPAVTTIGEFMRGK